MNALLNHQFTIIEALPFLFSFAVNLTSGLQERWITYWITTQLDKKTNSTIRDEYIRFAADTNFRLSFLVSIHLSLIAALSITINNKQFVAAGISGLALILIVFVVSLWLPTIDSYNLTQRIKIRNRKRRITKKSLIGIVSLFIEISLLGLAFFTAPPLK